MRALVLAAFTMLPTAQAAAQDVPGLPDAAGAPPRSEAPSFESQPVMQAPRASSSAGMEGLMALRESPDPPTVTLDQALREAATAHVDLRIAREKVVQQEQQVRKAWSYLLPHVDVGASYTFNCTFFGDVSANCADQTVQFADAEQLDQQATLFDAIGDLVERAAELDSDPVQQEESRAQARELHAAADQLRATDVAPVVVQPAQVLTGNLNVSMPLFNGRSIPLLMNAYEGVDVVKSAAAQARGALLYGTTRAYYAAVSAKKLVDISGRRMEQAARHREVAEQRAEARTLAPLSLKRAQLDFVRARQQVRAAQSAHRLAIAGLGSLLGRTTTFEVTDPPALPVVDAAQDVEVLVARAFAARPEVRAQRHALRIAERTRLDAWMMFMPSLALFGTARATSNANGFVDAPVNGAVGLQLSLPLYDGGLRYASLRESASRIREELLKARALEDRIAAQVRGNVAEVAVREEALSLAREALVVAAESRAQADALYEAGVGTSLDVSDTTLASTLAEAEVARAELDVAEARLGLAYATGAFPGGAESEGAPLTDAEEERARALLWDEAPAAR